MTLIMIPGAWAGEWLYDSVKDRLAGHCGAQALTLPGLEKGSTNPNITLMEHVDFVVNYVQDNDISRVTLVGHSYSGIVVGLAALRMKEVISHCIYIEAFLPEDGSTLLDIAGLPVEEELSTIKKHDGWWPPPTAEELNAQGSLHRSVMDLLLKRNRPHPGGTITERVSCSSIDLLAEVPSTFLGNDAWLNSRRNVPLISKLQTCDLWEFRSMTEGHWPMLSSPARIAQELASKCT